jgi:hypothetical protein
LLTLGQHDIDKRYHLYEQLAGVDREVAIAAAAEENAGDNA